MVLHFCEYTKNQWTVQFPDIKLYPSKAVKNWGKWHMVLCNSVSKPRSKTLEEYNCKWSPLQSWPQLRKSEGGGIFSFSPFLICHHPSCLPVTLNFTFQTYHPLPRPSHCGHGQMIPHGLIVEGQLYPLYTPSGFQRETKPMPRAFDLLRRMSCSPLAKLPSAICVAVRCSALTLNPDFRKCMHKLTFLIPTIELFSFPFFILEINNKE